MKKSIICLLLVTVLAAGLIFSAQAASTPDLKITGTSPSGGQSTVSVEFVNIPENNPVEYAQILLTCRSSQHSIVNNSMTLQFNTTDMLATQKFNTSADNVLLLIEPKQSSAAGIGNGPVCAFTVKHTATADRVFDLTAVLILKNGTEYEVNRRITITENGATQPTTTPNPGTTEPSTAPNPGSTQPTTTPNPGSSDPTSVPTTGTTEPATGTTQPTTVPSGNTDNQNGDGTWFIYILMAVVVFFFAGVCVAITVLRNKKQ